MELQFNFPIIVCGFARCGSSMMMRMLHEGGCPVLADNRSSYEHDSLNIGADITAMLPQMAGKASKLLEPQEANWPKAISGRVIWMRRDPVQQAKSQIKFLRLVNQMKIRNDAWMQVRESIVRDLPGCLRMLSSLGLEVLTLEFESVLGDPHRTAFMVAEFLNLPLNLTKMSGVVISRSSACAPDLSIEMDLVNKGVA